MTAEIWIAPHERHDALEAYAARLLPSQCEEIKDAPDDAWVRLEICAAGLRVVVLDETEK